MRTRLGAIDGTSLAMGSMARDSTRTPSRKRARSWE